MDDEKQRRMRGFGGGGGGDHVQTLRPQDKYSSSLQVVPPFLPLFILFLPLFFRLILYPFLSSRFTSTSQMTSNFIFCVSLPFTTLRSLVSPMLLFSLPFPPLSVFYFPAFSLFLNFSPKPSLPSLAPFFSLDRATGSTSCILAR